MKRINHDTFYEYIKRYDPDSEYHLVGEVDYTLLSDDQMMKETRRKMNETMDDHILDLMGFISFNENCCRRKPEEYEKTIHLLSE